MDIIQQRDKEKVFYQWISLANENIDEGLKNVNCYIIAKPDQRYRTSH